MRYVGDELLLELIHLINLAAHVVKGCTEPVKLITRGKVDAVIKIAFGIFVNTFDNRLKWSVNHYEIKRHEKKDKHHHNNKCHIVGVKCCIYLRTECAKRYVYGYISLDSVSVGNRSHNAQHILTEIIKKTSGLGIAAAASCIVKIIEPDAVLACNIAGCIHENVAVSIYEHNTFT